MTGPFTEFVFSQQARVAMPVAVYPGAALAGVTVRQIVSDPAAQVQAIRALQARFGFPVALTAMDLSCEAEAFGSSVRLTDGEVPTVIGRLIDAPEKIATLPHPSPGDARTGVGPNSIRLLRETSSDMVLGSMIGPFSLAGRLYGVSESLELTAEDPDAVLELVEHATAFLIEQARAIKAAGAAGLVMAEPTAGLLSPRALGQYSSPFVKRIVDEVCDRNFQIILHNCAAKLMHLPFVLQSDATALHFGAPMDMRGALQQAPNDVILFGNLDPAGVFVRSTPDEVEARTQELLLATAPFKNFVPSSGCDVPPDAPLANIDAFAKTIAAAQPA
jgi:uroporphyrinogen decarboxylase